MALTALQRAVCRRLAGQRKATASHRVSQDIDLFHDSTEAVQAGWEADRALLEGAGYDLSIVRERPSFVEAVVARAGDRVLVQWAADSAYRFFPLVEHPDFGLVLAPFDLARNKVLALVGRLEARDWIDVIAAHDAIRFRTGSLRGVLPTVHGAD